MVRRRRNHAAVNDDEARAIEGSVGFSRAIALTSLPEGRGSGWRTRGGATPGTHDTRGEEERLASGEGDTRGVQRRSEAVGVEGTACAWRSRMDSLGRRGFLLRRSVPPCGADAGRRSFDRSVGRSSRLRERNQRCLWLRLCGAYVARDDARGQLESPGMAGLAGYLPWLRRKRGTKPKRIPFPDEWWEHQASSTRTRGSPIQSSSWEYNGQKQWRSQDFFFESLARIWYSGSHVNNIYQCITSTYN
jgi:hypothetical protein